MTALPIGETKNLANDKPMARQVGRRMKAGE